MLPIQSGLSMEMLYPHFFSTFLWNMPLGWCKKTWWNQNYVGQISFSSVLTK
jgi:hypothetical protein